MCRIPVCKMIVLGVLLCLLQLCHSQSFLEVIDQQIIVPKIDEVVILFKLSIRNTGKDAAVNVVLRPDKCCFYADSRRECQVFTPIGDKVQYVKPNDKLTMTLFYVNYYIIGRYGECNGTLTHDDGAPQNVHFGVFNTTVPATYSWMPKHFGEWATGRQMCPTIDQDPSRGCEAVNCLYKYDGLVNYFDESKQICEPARPCFSNPTSSNPLWGLNLNDNSCDNLELNLTMDDIAFLQMQDESFLKSVYDVKKIKEVICVHGKLNPNNRTCQCDYGWLSDPHDRSPYDPITQVYYLCNTHGYSTSNRLKKVTATLIKLVVYLVILMLVACVLSFVFFCCAKMYIAYSGKKKKRNNWSLFGPMGGQEEARQPLFGSAVQNEPTDARTQHIETSWYSTGDSILDKALVHTANPGGENGVLTLAPGDVITDLEKTDIPGYWKGTSKDMRGIFPVSCAEFRRAGIISRPFPKR